MSRRSALVGILVLTAALATASWLSPAMAQDGFCDALDRVFGDRINHKLRNMKTAKKEHMGWVARVQLPGMDRCHVDEDMGFTSYTCDKTFADVAALEEAFKSHEQVIGKCFSGLRVRRDKTETKWTTGLNDISLSRRPMRRLQIMVY